MNSVLIAALAVFAIIILLSVLFLVIIMKRKRSLTQFPAKQSKLPNKGSGEISGQIYQWQQNSASQNKNPFFRLMISCKQEGRFTIRRENAFDRLAKRFGLVKEISVMDDAFDNTHFIITPHPQFCSQLLSHSSVKTTIITLLSRGFSHIKMDKNKLTAQWINYRPKENAINGDEIPMLAGELLEILKVSERLPLYDEDRNCQRTWVRKLAFLYSVTGLSLLVGLIALIIGLTQYSPLDPGQLFLYALKWSLPALTLFLFLSYSTLRGNSSAHSHLLTLFFISLTGIILLGFGATTFLNGHLDQSTAKAHSALILNKYYTKSKNNYTYYVQMESWRHGRKTEDQTVPPSLYNTVSLNESRLVVVTRAGHLGFEWTESYQLENR